MPHTLTFPPSDLEAFREGRKTRFSVPMEPQPQDVSRWVEGVSGEKYGWHYFPLIGSAVNYFPFYAPGDVILACSDEVKKPTDLSNERLARLTVLSCQPYKVSNITEEEARADVGELSANSGIFAELWTHTHPNHPFSTSWAWAVNVKLEKPE